ncbi:MAG: LPS export ABC transporter periplasmic protein LptC [Paludibacteraceae bacterium]|nr:LPS export ABC transporter periplasmic protein LptC [Paludibacteraceae bacterium]
MSRRQVISISVTACLLALLVSCGKEVRLRADAVSDRSAMPILDAGGVSTLISDSGVTRYRINAERWQVYDKAQPSYWEFKQGVYLEKFDEHLVVEASIRSDYAKYLDKEGLWELDGNVHAMNEQGEQFDTPQLFWNQNEETIYSDSAITIHRASSTITGYGFRSNQTMTNYIILQPTGFFPVDQMEQDSI